MRVAGFLSMESCERPLPNKVLTDDEVATGYGKSTAIERHLSWWNLSAYFRHEGYRRRNALTSQFAGATASESKCTNGIHRTGQYRNSNYIAGNDRRVTKKHVVEEVTHGGDNLVIEHIATGSAMLYEWLEGVDNRGPIRTLQHSLDLPNISGTLDALKQILRLLWYVKLNAYVHGVRFSHKKRINGPNFDLYPN